MSEVTVSIHNHHERILRELREQSAVFAAEPSPPNSGRILTLLRDDLLKEMEREDRELYPSIDRVMKAAGGLATSSMAVDHEFIAEYIDWIEAALRSLPGATGARRDLLLVQLKRYLTQLEAVLNLHFEKEDRLFLPIVERRLPLAAQRRVREAMLSDGITVSPAPAAQRAAVAPVRERASSGATGKKKLVRSKRGKRSAPGMNRRPRR